MNARERRDADAARAKLEAQRAAGLAARTKVAAGISLGIADAVPLLEAWLAGIEVSTVGELLVGHSDVLEEVITLARVLAGRILEQLGFDETDPAKLGGQIAGPGGAHDFAGVVVDVDRALLEESMTVVQVTDIGENLNADEVLVGLETVGRVNRTTERLRHLHLTNVDGAAGYIVELYALAERGGWLPALQAAIDQRVAGLPAPPEATDGGD